MFLKRSRSIRNTASLCPPVTALRMYCASRSRNRRAVGEPGERIVVGEVVEPVLLLEVIDRERDVARQLAQQLHLLVVEEPGLVGVQGKHADRFVGNQQRQDGHRSGPALGDVPP